MEWIKPQADGWRDDEEREGRILAGKKGKEKKLIEKHMKSDHLIQSLSHTQLNMFCNTDWIDHQSATVSIDSLSEPETS